MPRLLAPALGGFALLDNSAHAPRAGCSDGDRLHDAHDGRVLVRIRRGTHAIPAPVTVRRGVLAAASPALWDEMVTRVRHSADGAIRRLLDSAPAFFAEIGNGRMPGRRSVDLIVDSTFALVRNCRLAR